MCDSLLLGGRHFAGADIEVAVHLCGIADENFAAETLCERDSERGFSGSGGTENYAEAWQRAHRLQCVNFQRVSRMASTITPSRSAPRIWVRLRFIRNSKISDSREEIQRGALLRAGRGRLDVVVEAETQLDVGPLELRWQWLERTRCANRRCRGRIERRFSRCALHDEAIGRETSIGVDPEGDSDDALIAEIGGLRHYGHPILAHLRNESIQVAVEIHAVGRSKNRNAVADLRTTDGVDFNSYLNRR